MNRTAHHPKLIKLTAVAARALSATARSPLSAAGFIPAGAWAGFIGLDALGTGAGFVHRGDLLLGGLAPHVSAGGAVDNLGFHDIIRLIGGSSHTARFLFTT